MTDTNNIDASNDNTESKKNKKTNNESPIVELHPVAKKRRSSSIDMATIHRTQFKSNEEIGESWIFQFFTLLNYRLAQWFHGFKMVDPESIPEGGALMIGFHSTHNQDIMVAITGMYAATGRVTRGLLHRMVFRVYPWVGYLGLVPGQRKTAIQLLKRGHCVSVLPGGGEEAMYGHEHAYDLHPRWHDRKGYASVAKEAGVPIVPIFAKNVEEMRFNLIFYIANLIGFTRFYASTLSHLETKKKESPKSLLWKNLAWIVKQIGLVTWFCCSWIFSFWIPVQVTMYHGEPIHIGKDESLESICKRSREGLQALIDEHQPHGHSYLPGLKERWENLFPKTVLASEVAETGAKKNN